MTLFSLNGWQETISSSGEVILSARRRPPLRISLAAATSCLYGLLRGQDVASHCNHKMSLYYNGRVENFRKQHISVVRTAVPFSFLAITFTSCVGTTLLSLLTKPQSELPQC